MVLQIIPAMLVHQSFVSSAKGGNRGLQVIWGDEHFEVHVKFARLVDWQGGRSSVLHGPA
jgi:hypothetical protein